MLRPDPCRCGDCLGCELSSVRTRAAQKRVLRTEAQAAADDHERACARLLKRYGAGDTEEQLAGLRAEVARTSARREALGAARHPEAHP